jgi:hypothetical protein
MQRQILLALIAGLFLFCSGCTQAKRKSKVRRATPTASRSTNSRPLPTLGGSPAGSANRTKGPQTMRGLMVDAWKTDLTSPSSDKKIRACEELGNMGSNAKSVLPDLQKTARDGNPKVAAAAKAAIAAINR